MTRRTAEIGEVEAAPVYLRATQLSQVGGLVGIPLSVALASMQLALPLWVSGAGFWGLACLLLWTTCQNRGIDR